jgi:hypothetical protein
MTHINSSYRSCFMPVQAFSLNHPEYDFVWNWEMDIRFTGTYDELFEQSIGENISSVLISPHHTLTRASNTDYAKNQSENGEMERYRHWLVPQVPQSEAEWTSRSISTTEPDKEADLITYNPIFDPRESGWYWEYDIQSECALDKGWKARNVFH